MICRMGDLRNKEVINVKDGGRVGFVCDIEIDTATARLSAVIIYGKLRFLGLLGREKDIVIPWEKIKLIGDDIVLVEIEGSFGTKRKNIVSDFLEKMDL